jgi:hypothetical protein
MTASAARATVPAPRISAGIAVLDPVAIGKGAAV